VATLGPGTAPDAVVTSIASALRLPAGTAGAVVGAASPLEAAEPTFEEGDLFVLLAARGTLLSDVEQAMEVAVHRRCEVVAVLLTGRVSPARTDAGVEESASGWRGDELDLETDPDGVTDTVHGAPEDTQEDHATANGADVVRRDADRARRQAVRDGELQR